MAITLDQSLFLQKSLKHVKLILFHCNRTLVCFVMLRYSVITVKIMLQVIITKKSKFMAFKPLALLLKYQLSPLGKLKHLNR